MVLRPCICMTDLVNWTHSMLAILAFVAGLLVAMCGTFHLLRRRRSNNLRHDVLPLHFIFTPRVEFAFHEVGRKDDPLVLVIHGFPDCAASFCSILPHIASQGYHAVACYLPGYFPTSLSSDDDYSLVAVTRSVMDLVFALGHREAIIIGHDWGGYVAITAATLHPNVFRRVAVLCVPHMRAFKLLPLMQLVRSWYVFLFQIPFLPYRLLPTWNFVFIDLLYRTWSPGSSFCETHLQRVRATLSRPGCTRAAIKYYTGLRDLKSLQVMFARCNVPALQVAGKMDGCMGVGVFAGAKLGFSDTYDLQVIGGGHFPHVERPQELIEILLRWLSSA